MGQPEETALIEHEIGASPAMFMIDGHHRFHALKTLKQPLTAWVVPLQHLQVNSFIKVFKRPTSRCFFEKLLNDFNVTLQSHTDVVYEKPHVCMHHEGMRYVIQEDENTTFSDVLCDLFAMIEEEKFEMVALQNNTKASRLKLMDKYAAHHLVVEHTPLGLSAVLHDNRLYPSHSTCFNPKPSADFLMKHKKFLLT